MDSYRIFETSSFREDLDSLPPDIRQRIEGKLRGSVYPRLRRAPYFGPNIRKLRDWKPETWRCRIGAWRLFYEIDDHEKTVFLLTLEQRKDAY